MMTRVSLLVALLPALLSGPAACSKFGASDDTTPDAGVGADAATAETSAPAQPHRIYVYGGVSVPGGSAITTAYASTLTSNGDFGPWELVPGLGDPRSAAAWVQNGNALTVASGIVPGTMVSADGARGALPDASGAPAKAWVKTASMMTARRYASALARGTSVYVSGGTNGTATLGNVELYDTVHDTWSPAGSLAASVSGHATFLRDSMMYVVGGDQGAAGGLTKSVKRAGFADGDGSLLAAEGAGDLKAPVARHSIALIEPWLFVIGGDGTGGTAVATVARGTFDAAGMLSWELIAPLAVPDTQAGLAEACTVVIDHTIYVMGGRDRAAAAATKAAYVGRVDGQGVITWTPSPISLPEGRSAFGCAVGP